MAQSPQFNFRDATRTQAKASILIEGLSGSGKSGLALLLGYYLSGKKWENIYALDTENKSLDLFQGVQASTGVPYGTFKKFDLTELHGYTPSNYINAREAAIHAGAEVFINDSLTHMWTMKGGVLDLVSEVDKSNSGRVKYNAWGDPTVVAEKQKIYARRLRQDNRLPNLHPQGDHPQSLLRNRPNFLRLRSHRNRRSHLPSRQKNHLRNRSLNRTLHHHHRTLGTSLSFQLKKLQIVD